MSSPIGTSSNSTLFGVIALGTIRGALAGAATSSAALSLFGIFEQSGIIHQSLPFGALPVLLISTTIGGGIGGSVEIVRHLAAMRSFSTQSSVEYIELTNVMPA